MNSELHYSWSKRLSTEFDKPYFYDLVQFVDREYDRFLCFPVKENIFKALNTCTFDMVKVVILGQDPYHGLNQANGLSFSVSDNMAHPPSLVNIFKEIETDLNIDYPNSGNLVRWAQQGVLLLNATLTVRSNIAGSHQKKGWEQFTNAIISLISREKENVVFLLWGGMAKKKIGLVDSQRHTILTSGHPSPLSANRGYWFGNKHFSKTNSLLGQAGLSPIQW